MNRPDLRHGEPPRVEVRRIGRWTWAVEVVHGILRWGPDGGPFIVFGTRARAERKASAELLRYLRSRELETEAVTVYIAGRAES